ncbi:dethiobiotin synthase [Neiella marina]|uniref:ATP-dependent dethiobiotin synthetase BioD n=1 Tax=Neiella holothuriorum TaxID=2870530 RepID=A0ABS7EDC9_9GAMM|nr:dethiobiotin synthase [Neiella holothuriorum]MBW8190260.1 dethiobiotin synthase [Neiella holothuriorum]
MTVVFVTATDTDAGKTAISQAWLYGARAMGKQVLGYKPIAAGADWHNGQLINEDAQRLAEQSSADLTAGDINPVCFEPPIAPHIAAAADNKEIELAKIDQHFQQLRQIHPADFCLVEGAGGWRLPLNLQGDTLAKWPAHNKWPVVMVVGLKLGCLNHALLTAEAIYGDGCELAGWIGNGVDPTMANQQANIDSLNALLHAPCLGIVPHLKDPNPTAIWSHLNNGLTALSQRL